MRSWKITEGEAACHLVVPKDKVGGIGFLEKMSRNADEMATNRFNNLDDETRGIYPQKPNHGWRYKVRYPNNEAEASASHYSTGTQNDTPDFLHKEQKHRAYRHDRQQDRDEKG